MHSAPAVVFPVGRFVWGYRFAFLLAAVSALVIGAVWWTSGISPMRVLACFLVWAATAVLSWRAFHRMALPPGRLAWDGEGWHFEPDGGLAQAVELAVRLDLGPFMLVEVLDLQGSRYAGLSALQQPALWHGWRCAVYGRDIL